SPSLLFPTQNPFPHLAILYLSAIITSGVWSCEEVDMLGTCASPEDLVSLIGC
ncbi:hypothetical protein NDU88_002353, partial [Pleurodeles waltl]